MKPDFYTNESRVLQDKFLSRSLADQLVKTRRHQEFSDSDREIINKAPLFFLATASAEGFPDCSVKGGNPGFVKIVNSTMLVFPDYDGNGMYRSLGNINANPHIGMLFLEYEGERRKLRINGHATVSEEPHFLNQLPGAKLAILVKVEDIFPNCPRYVPEIEVKKKSLFNPAVGYVPPEPGWKSKEDLKDYLSQRIEK
ncbi:pyridoxamine 5'-phosphate oxidase family protein [Pantoea agglomerans]|jgi:predicted pyridoxine 5'-phosphate oxidase superfamily flavin-nucleotide-binding protein|uniref:pyridoxamine 5'-phosphate oxidase family protein n=1 Tax=Enterobacter agglomerans TaxID=549 RepID=UPI0005E62E4A|nr:pyridoxamine 5'-phosphate oxidase family protein [Pantoea agglomerans]KJH63216.1 hypothetical protein UF13_04800 [Pantoea agglomerans]QTC51415.1 pyridoxamine 5'-phosphate oxidase family protein [Pantoea agglomerans]